MTAWTDTLMERASAGRRRNAAADARDVGYGGPADGDFARYVDQLMAQAEAQQRPRSPARAATALSADARRAGAASRDPAAPARVRPAAARAAHAGVRALVWRKLFPWALWIVVAVAVFFWQAGAIWLIGLLIVLGVLSRGLRGKKR